MVVVDTALDVVADAGFISLVHQIIAEQISGISFAQGSLDLTGGTRSVASNEVVAVVYVAGVTVADSLNTNGVRVEVGVKAFKALN